MIRHLWFPPLGMFLGVVLTAWLFAQEPAPVDPFGESASAPKAAPVDADKKRKEKAAKAETDPVVLAIRESNPQTPAEVLQVAINLANYGRADEAKRYLTALINSHLDDAASWRLQRKFGTAPFIRLSSQEDLQPVGKQLAESILNGSQKYIRDPARLGNLIQQLSDAKNDVRRGAMADLTEAGEDAAVAMISVLGDTSRESEHPVVRAALNRMGTVATGALLGSLDTPNASLRLQVVSVLGRQKTTEAIPFLLRPYLLSESGSAQHESSSAALTQLLGRLPTRAEVERFLHRQIISYFDGRLPGKPDYEDRIELWRWDTAQQRPVKERLDSTSAPLLFASRLAAELTAIAPENREYRRLQLAAVLELTKLTAGWEAPLPTGPGTASELAMQHLGVIEDVLRFALDRGQIGAAVGSLEVIGRTGDFSYLVGGSGHPRDVAKALRNSNRRVRFAALQAVLRLAPQQPFAGASYVPETIAYFARTSGSRRVLIAHPRPESSQSLAGIFRDLGVESDLVVTGTQAFQAARRNPDYEFVLLSDGLDRPPVLEQAQQFRRDPLTARLPIGILARSENFERLRQSPWIDDSLTEVFAPPTDAQGAAFLFRRLLDRTIRDYVPFEERLRQADFVLESWATLAAHPERFGFYDLLSQQSAAESALTVPRLAVKATRVLGLLGSPQAQRSLVSLANQSNLPLVDRQAAAVAFGVAVVRHGVLLTQAEILRQYDLYNQSATADVRIQQLLGSILDAMEDPGTAQPGTAQPGTAQPGTGEPSPPTPAPPEPAPAEPAPAESRGAASPPLNQGIP